MKAPDIASQGRRFLQHARHGIVLLELNFHWDAFFKAGSVVGDIIQASASFVTVMLDGRRDFVANLQIESPSTTVLGR